MAGSPHDTLVKKTFSIAANADGEFRAILPAQVTALIDWSTLKNEPGSFVDPDARARHTDLLFSAQLAGRRALLYLLLEHQSRVERWMPKRMLTYIDRIWTAEREKNAKRLPIVLPMVLHHSKSGWTAGRHMHDLLDVSPDALDIVRRYVPGFELLIDDLGRVPEAELLRRPMTAMGAGARASQAGRRRGGAEGLLRLPYQRPPRGRAARSHPQFPGRRECSRGRDGNPQAVGRRGRSARARRGRGAGTR